MPKDLGDLVLLTDLYEFTMAAAFYQHKMFAPATFSLFIRAYGPDRGYFVSAGLEDVLELLESFRFGEEQLNYLASLGLFADDFLHYLGGLRFTGRVRAIPEGRLFFRTEPVLEITAPLIEAQLVETLVINLINLPVAIASKAARCYHAAGGRSLIDFSLRRTQGTDAGLKVARSSYLAGFNGTSNVLAGKRYGIPLSGTMAHSFITSFTEEIDAFRAFAQSFPNDTVLLIDTYDTIAGAAKAAQVHHEMRQHGRGLQGVRLDSGDMAALSRQVAALFREKNVDGVRIFASGGFDEFKIAATLSGEGEPIDGFGVGTKMGVAADAPYNDIVYKLVQYDGRPVLKLSTGKKTLVGEKQVYRLIDQGSLVGDVIALLAEPQQGEALLQQVMQGGVRLQPPEALTVIRERFLDEFRRLPESCKYLKDPGDYPVGLGKQLERLQESVTSQLAAKQQAAAAAGGGPAGAAGS